MPEFERDPWGQHDMYQDQLRHYRIKQGVLPDAKPAPQETAVPSGTKLTDRTGMPVPRRKPVSAGDSSSRGRSPRPASPASSRSQSPQTQSPVRTIYRKDGRFDPSTIQAPRQAPTPPASPTTSIKPTQRTNSNASTGSWSARRSSFSKGIRRLSDAVKNGLNIVKMDRHERIGYVRTKDDKSQSRTTSLAPRSPISTPTRPTYIAGKFGENLDDEPSRPPQPPAPTKALPGNLSKGEKFAMSVSKAADPLKPRRKGTQDSDMSFGMTDLAPPGAMQECESCAKPTAEYLVKGLCKQCHELHVKVAKAKRDEKGPMFVDPWQFPQGRSTWPDVPTADQKYMKLPSRKKILRIRETIYEDPGNPFADEADRVSPSTRPAEDKPLPPPPPIDDEEASAEIDPFDINPFDDGAFAKVPTTPKNSVADPWQDFITSRARADSLRSHRRSKSVAVPLPNLNDEFGEYIAPRKYWRKGSVPTSHLSQPIPPSHDSWRDTRFDAFYDELIQDYGNGKSKI